MARKFPKLRDWLAGAKLDWQMQKGTKARGRAPGADAHENNTRVKRKRKKEEAKLRGRSLKRAIEFALDTPIFRDPRPNEGAIFPTGRLFAKKLCADGSIEDIGLISTKVVTTAGVNYIVDAFQNSTELENMKYHGSGTDNTAENSSDTTLGAETAETRATGTTAEGASANIYQTVGTISYTGTRAIVEHGIFSASTSGVLLDRSVFSVINVVNGDAIEFTYELTFPAGS